MEEEKKEKKNDANIDKIVNDLENDAALASEKYGVNDVSNDEVIYEDPLDRIDIEIFKLEVELDKMEINMANDDYADEHYEEYRDLKNKIKELNKQRKEIKKNKVVDEETNKLNEVQMWIFFYGIVITIMSLPGISYKLWLSFAQWLIKIVGNSLDSIINIKWLYYLFIGSIIYALPLFLILLSWMLFINLVKKKINKIIFAIFWILQGIGSIAMMIYVGIIIFGG